MSLFVGDRLGCRFGWNWNSSIHPSIHKSGGHFTCRYAIVVLLASQAVILYVSQRVCVSLLARQSASCSSCLSYCTSKRQCRRQIDSACVSVTQVIVFVFTQVIGWSAKDKYLHFLICNLVNVVFSKLQVCQVYRK